MHISFVNQKGGVGKTTLAVHIADKLARLGIFKLNLFSQTLLQQISLIRVIDEQAQNGLHPRSVLRGVRGPSYPSA